jgi:hypothetical protein
VYSKKLTTFSDADDIKPITEYKEGELAGLRLSDLGKEGNTIGGDVSCCQLFSCNKSTWKAYMGQNSNGLKWLTTIMLFQILFIFIYIGMDIH